jgi:hypothetical protein
MSRSHFGTIACRPASVVASVVTPRARRLAAFVVLAAGLASLAPPLRAQDAATPAPTPLARHLDPSRLRVGTDSFTILVQGVPRGWERLGAAREGGEWVLSDAVAIAPVVQQESRIRFDAALGERSLRQDGRMGGAPMRIALDFADGAVRGTALTPSRPGGPVDIALAVPAGTVDDNAVLPLLAVVRWRADLDVAFPVLLSGKGTVITQRLRVLGPDTTTVPAGRFDTWRAELTGGEARVVVHVERAAPHHILRVQPSGAPFDVQRVR